MSSLRKVVGGICIQYFESLKIYLYLKAPTILKCYEAANIKWKVNLLKFLRKRIRVENLRKHDSKAGTEQQRKIIFVGTEQTPVTEPTVPFQGWSPEQSTPRPALYLLHELSNNYLDCFIIGTQRAPFTAHYAEQRRGSQHQNRKSFILSVMFSLSLTQVSEIGTASNATMSLSQ